jgi:hypothetical protein
MKNKKYYILIALIFVTASLFCPSVTLAQTKFTKAKKISKVIKPQVKIQNSISDHIFIDVKGVSYQVDVPKNSTVYDAMRILSDIPRSNFSFHVKEYPGLGKFVDEVNNVKGKPGKYWIYYINNKEASVGVSNYILAKGDKVSWKQEGF